MTLLGRPVPTRATRLPRLTAAVVLALLLAGLGGGRALGATREPWAMARFAALREARDPTGMWPLDPVPQVVAGFDPPASTWGAGHRGVDLLATPGQRVRSALAGRVAFVGRIAGRGVVVVDHGATRTTYEPVVADVETGASVAAGDGLGTLELSGSHCPPRACLHWGWIRGDTYLDPLRLVGAGPVRLLPLWRDEPVVGRATAPSRPSLPLPYAGWRSPLRLFLTCGWAP